MAKPSGLEMMPEAMKIRKIREMELEIDSLKGRILEAVVEFDKLQEENADLVIALNDALAFCNDTVLNGNVDWEILSATANSIEQALAKVKGDKS